MNSFEKIDGSASTATPTCAGIHGVDSRAEVETRGVIRARAIVPKSGSNEDIVSTLATDHDLAQLLEATDL